MDRVGGIDNNERRSGARRGQVFCCWIGVAAGAALLGGHTRSEGSVRGSIHGAKAACRGANTERRLRVGEHIRSEGGVQGSVHGVQWCMEYAGAV